MTERQTIRITCPLVIPALFFAAGIASGRHTPFLTVPPVYTILSIAFIITGYLLIRREKSILQTLVIALAFFLIGNANSAAIRPPSLDQHLSAIAVSGQDGVFSGILRSAPAFNGSKGNFVVAVDLLRGEKGSAIPVTSRILFKTTFPPPTDLVVGERVLIRASLSIPTPPGTPGSFDYRQYLHDRRIPITGFIRSPAHLSPLRADPSPPNHLQQLLHLPQYLRYKTNLFIDSTEQPLKIRALYKAIITGQRDSIPIKVLDNFKRSGAIHLLAISGMHMGLLALLSGLLLNYLLRKSTWLMLRWPAWKIASLLTLLIMGGYAAISGLQPPVVRAFIMAAMVIIAVVLDRPQSMLNTVALAALLILFYDPTALFSVSFQLSFAAVIAIILFSNRFPDLFQPEKPPQRTITMVRFWLGTGIAVSVVAIFATAPISLYHFHQVSMLGPVTTILTAPLICFWALPLGLTATLISPWLPDTAQLVLSLGSVGLRGADLITSTLAAIPGTFQTLPPPSLIAMAAYYLLAAYLFIFQSGKRVKIGVGVAMILILALPAGNFALGKSDDETRVTFLDVGQGNATLMELPGDINILVDGGGASAPGFNPGEQIIGPFLWHQSLRHLTALVISHPHQDHYNGLEFIIRNFRPQEIWINGAEEKSPEYGHLLRTAAESGAIIRVPDRGTVLASGGSAKLTCISDLHRNTALSTNSRSLVIRLEAGDKKIILPGDIMKDAGRQLIAEGVALQSDVLLAPHHGSRYAAGYELVEAGEPKWLVVSASPFRAEYFPDPEFAEWCRKRGTKVINTARSGAITFTFREKDRINWQAISGKTAKKKP